MPSRASWLATPFVQVWEPVLRKCIVYETVAVGRKTGQGASSTHAVCHPVAPATGVGASVAARSERHTAARNGLTAQLSRGTPFRCYDEDADCDGPERS